MESESKRQLENQLMVMGLRQLQDPELIAQMAHILNAHPGYTDPHAFYMGLLGECDPQQRHDMYEAVRPHLKFQPWPLDKYEAMIAEPTANANSREHPVEIGEGKPKEPVYINGQAFEQVNAADAEWCFLTLKCCKCTFEQEFGGFTIVAAMQVARNEGWVRDIVKQKEICPKCPAVRPN